MRSPTARSTCNVRRVHVVIMGCGRVGSTLARSLEERNHTVSVIDSDPDAFRRLGPMFNGTKVTGYGFDQGVLTEAGIARADAFAAVSSGDNSNIIAARVARTRGSGSRRASRLVRGSAVVRSTATTVRTDVRSLPASTAGAVTSHTTATSAPQSASCVVSSARV